MIIHAGDLPDILYYIISGSVEVMIEDEDGNEMVLAYLNKGQFFGEMGLFYEQPTRSAWVRTRQQSELAEMTYPRFRQIAAESPGLIFELATQLATRLDRTNRKLGDLAFVDVTGRVAHAIMDLCGEPDAMTHPEGMQIKVSRQELSRLVGCSREMAGRVLKVLEDQGLLRATGKTIVVFNARPKVKTRPLIVPVKAGPVRRRARAPRRGMTMTTTMMRTRTTNRVAASAASSCRRRARYLPRASPQSSPHSRRCRKWRNPRRMYRPRRGRSRAAFSTFTPPSISRRIRGRCASMRAAHLRELGQRLRDELLAAESRIHRHDQHQIDLVDHVVQPVQRRRRIEHQSRRAARVADQLDGAVDVLGGFRMKADVRRARLGEVGDHAVDRR